MSKYFIHYAINEKQLFISLFHEPITALTTIRKLIGPRKITTHKLPDDFDKEVAANVSPTNPIELSPFDKVQIDINKAMNIILNNAVDNYGGSFEEVCIAADVNLGFSAQEKYPPFLFNSSMHAWIREKERFKNAKICLFLESSHPPIADKALKEYNERYKQYHKDTYEKCPVYIRVKGHNTNYSFHYIESPPQRRSRTSSPQTISPQSCTPYTPSRSSSPRRNRSTSNSPRTSPTLNQKKHSTMQDDEKRIMPSQNLVRLSYLNSNQQSFFPIEPANSPPTADEVAPQIIQRYKN